MISRLSVKLNKRNSELKFIYIILTRFLVLPPITQ
jgi:hypothetical protein